MLALLRFAHIIALAMGNKIFYVTSYFHVEKVPTARGRQVRKHMSACQWSIGEKKMDANLQQDACIKERNGKLKIH